MVSGAKPGMCPFATLALLWCPTAQSHLVCIICVPTQLLADREPRQTGQHGARGPVGRRVQLSLRGQAEDAGAEGQEAAPAVPGALPGWDPELHCTGSAAPERWVPRGPRPAVQLPLSEPDIPAVTVHPWQLPLLQGAGHAALGHCFLPYLRPQSERLGASFLGPGDPPRAAFASHQGKQFCSGDSAQYAPT